VRRSAFLAIALALAVATPATAAEVKVTVESSHDGTIAYVELHAEPGEANAITVTGAPRRIVIRDTGAVLDAGPGCAALGPHEVVCSGSAPRSVTIHAGDRDDVLADAAPGVSAGFYGGAGDDRLDGDDDPQWHDGGDGADQLLAGDGLDYLLGGAGPDVLRGGDGYDEILGDPPGPGAWPDVLDGGPGDDDAVRYDGRETGVWIDLASSAPQGGPGEGDVLTGFERAAGGDGADVILGTDGPNLLQGGGSFDSPGDVLDGRGGSDRLSGTHGDDLVRGGPGDDHLDGGFGGTDTYEGGPGDDAVALDLAPFDDPRDEARARVVCGTGGDSVYAPDWRALVPRDCEVVTFELLDGLRFRHRRPTRLVLAFDAERFAYRCLTVTAARPGARRPLARRAVRLRRRRPVIAALDWRRPVSGRVVVRLRARDRCGGRRDYRIGAFSIRLTAP
jgi:RTX calcium-binding nonapeptide repeat (4 copies)